jgi:hypothetical protein
MSATKFIPRIFLLGPPASGKTTIRSQIEDWWRDRRGVQLSRLGILEVHRQQCPIGGDSHAYRYDENGAIFLVEEKRLIQEALEILTEQCQQSENGFVVEIAHMQISTVIATLGRDKFAGGLVFFLTAPVAVRLDRNRQRKADHVPEHFVIACPGELSNQEVSAMRDIGSTLCVIDTRLSVERTRSVVEDALTRYVQDLGSGAGTPRYEMWAFAEEEP